MRLSRKQTLELDSIKDFIPDWCTFEPIKDKDIATFFAWSDKGKPYELGYDLSGLAALHYGKQYRDLHVTQYRQDIEDGILPKWEVNKNEWWNKALKGSVPGPGVANLWKSLAKRPKWYRRLWDRVKSWIN